MIQLQLTALRLARRLLDNLRGNLRRNLMITVWMITGILLAGCGGTPAPTAPATLDLSRPTSAMLPPLPEWREASEPITLENITQLERLGVLSVPDGSGTLYGYAISPDNTQFAAINDAWLLAWNLVTGELLFRSTRQGESQLFYSPAKEELYGLAASGGIYFYDSTTGSEIAALPPPITFSEAGFSGAFDYHADSGVMALGLENGDIVIWNLLDPQEPHLLAHTGAASQIYDLAFSGDGAALAVVYGEEQANRISVWDWRDSVRLTDTENSPATPSDLVIDVAFSSDGRFLAGMRSGSVIIWNAETGALLHELSLPVSGGTLLFRFIPDSSMLLTGGIGSNIQLWDAERGAAIGTLPETASDPNSMNPIGATISPDHLLMFTARLDQPVWLWNLTNVAAGTIARSSQPFGSETIFDVVWTTDSFSVLMIDAHGPVEVWGIAAG